MSKLPKNDCINSKTSFYKKEQSLLVVHVVFFTNASRQCRLLHSLMSEFTPAEVHSFGAPEMKAWHVMNVVSWHTPIRFPSVLVGGHAEWLLATSANLQMQTGYVTHCGDRLS